MKNLKLSHLLFLSLLCLSLSCKKSHQEASSLDNLLKPTAKESSFKIDVLTDTIPKMSLDEIVKAQLKPIKSKVSGDKVQASTSGFTANYSADFTTHNCTASGVNDPYIVYVEWYLLKDGLQIAYLGSTSSTSISFKLTNPAYGSYSVKAYPTFYDSVRGQYVQNPPSTTGSLILPLSLTEAINGKFVNDNSTGRILIGMEGKWRHIESQNTLYGLFDFNTGMLTYLNNLNGLPPVGSPIKIDNGLINDRSTGKVYLREGNLIRHITSLAVKDKYHFKWSNIVNVNNVSNYTIGAPLY